VCTLVAVDESNLEESLAAFRQTRAIDAVASMQRRSVARGADSLIVEDIDAEIVAVREARRH
jgi:hypothetical protein